MSILGWLVIGLIVGALAKLIMPVKDPGGILMTMLLGIIGAFLGGLLGSAIFGTGLGSFWAPRTWILGLIGSLIVLGVYRLVIGRKAIKN